ncbi:hypothetical protein [Agrobacterium tumefaciens]|uniref:hypothetical protein n=1 Tax=Agrobacterium tumefaciens TaxID=358 RepID=UPI001178A8B5
MLTVLESKNAPSIFADPLAWAVADFVGGLLGETELASSDRIQTGLIVVSDLCSLSTIRALSAMAKQDFLSPLKFAGASPSIVSGLAALREQIRGPTVTFTMDPRTSRAAITALIRLWMMFNSVSPVIVVTHLEVPDVGHHLKGRLLFAPNPNLDSEVDDLCEIVGKC